MRPQSFDLSALAESWQVEYRETRGRAVGVRTDRPGRIIVSGAVADPGACQAALRRWLARRARDVLAPWLDLVAQDTGLTYRRLTVKNQRTRWGSCSTQGHISLNCKLLFFPRPGALRDAPRTLSHPATEPLQLLLDAAAPVRARCG